ncbi:hypothetical protein [Actinomadura macrotermitis]|uniref:DUF3558 domain-containing protein n=1 Tax=Actinomadura macrotermitis TaxID=2585200 RepID=A0A7K0C2B6_9ACTN|nr:hypothetical protein [Actinomadura macrotermitis]MQY07560.1 hypothetical protein [Actinomadura macrotermitis]
MSGSHRSGSHRTDSYRGPSGGQPSGDGHPTGSGAYRPEEQGSGGYGPGEHGPGGYGSGQYGSGQYGSGEYGSGEYGSGQYGSGQYETDRYRTVRPESGQYGTGAATGGYRSREHGSGEYRSGEHGTGPQRRAGSRRSTGGRTGSGSHRVMRERRRGRGLGLLIGGLAAGIGVCVLAAFAIFSGTGVGRHDTGQIVGSSGAAGAAGTGPTAQSERTSVPDACDTLPAAVAGRLAPNADRTPADNYQSNDRQNQCVWGAYTGDRKRQLTVEVRALAGTAGRTPTDVAHRSFESERGADESGKALLSGQELTSKSRPDDLGDEGYVIYSVDKGAGAGEAIANVRVVNVLVTVHYSGGNDGDPLSSDEATKGAVEAARSMVDALNKQ